MSEPIRSDPPQVLAVALNPALDHTIEVECLRVGEVNRASRMRAQVGGKGFNVASCLADFGIPTAVTGLLGSDNAEPFEALFRAKGITDRCLRLDGSTRVNTKLVDHATGQTTDLNLPGPALSAQVRQALMDGLLARIDSVMDSVRWVVLAGSLPPDWPDDTYCRLAQHVRRAGGRVVLDASGPALAEGLKAAPDLIKPNRAELAELVGRGLGSLDDIVAAARALMAGAAGPGAVVVSMGGEGALFLDREQALLAHPSRVDLLSTVGAGDAMVAGLVAARVEGLPLAEGARLATAFAAAKLARLGPHLPAPDVVRSLAGTVRITPLP